MQGKAMDIKGQTNVGGDMDPSIVKADSSSDQEGQTFPPLSEALDSRSQGKFCPNIICAHRLQGCTFVLPAFLFFSLFALGTLEACNAWFGLVVATRLCITCPKPA
jgi:hypothetical protein